MRIAEELLSATLRWLIRVSQCQTCEALALSEFIRTMQVYTDLVVKGIVPSADDGEKLIG